MLKKKLSNVDLINIIVDDINENPKLLRSEQIKEEDFINAFSEKDNVELRGVINVEPHLKNLFLDVLYNRIIRVGVVDGLHKVNSLDIFRSEDLTVGDRFSRIVVDTISGKDFDSNASPIGVSKGRIGECFSDTPIKKLFEVTFSDEQIKSAFDNENGVNNLLEAFLKKLNDSANLFIYEEVRKQILNDKSLTSPNVNFKTLLSGYKLGNLCLVGGENAYDDTTISALRTLRFNINAYASKLSIPNRLYNIGDTNGKFMTSLEKGILILDPTLITGLEYIDDTLFSGSSSWKEKFKEVIPVNAWLSEVSPGTLEFTCLGGIFDPKFIEYKVMLEKTLNWNNPKALYTNYFSHIWFTILVNPYLTSLFFVEQ